VEIARFADWHYAPTATAAANLDAEGVEPSQVILTGNTVVSALARYGKASRRCNCDIWQEKPEPHCCQCFISDVGGAGFKPIRQEHKCEYTTPTKHVLVTLHRHEIQNDVDANGLALAVCFTAKRHPEIEFVWPIHPGFRQHCKLRSQENLKVTEHIAYRAFTALLASARGVITDSGGIVEEAATLGTPVAILRDVNDRPEAEEAGIAKLIGLRAGCVDRAMEFILGAERKPSTVFGGPDAARKVAEHLWQISE
jgi:UDP-N-acetylglucosamine 2-epimerase (non-hydrolysing)